MRTLCLSFMLIASPALAHDGTVTKDEVSAFKDAWKTEMKQSKDLERLAKQWTAAWSKKSMPKMHKVDFKLVELRKEIMQDLRDDGISTREKGVDDGAPVQERFRDLLVELREGQKAFDDETAPKADYKRKADLLALLVAEVQKRAARYELRYQTHKDELKGK